MTQLELDTQLTAITVTRWR